VPFETVDGQIQGGVYELPLPGFPTGIMRGRFHPDNGHLYVCGLVGWSSNQPAAGGFYRVRRTEQPLDVPLAIHAKRNRLELSFSAPLEPAIAENPGSYALTVWGLKRSAVYGSPYVNEHTLVLTRATVAPDGRTVLLEVPDLQPTWGDENPIYSADRRPADEGRDPQ
jgi:hypothetical protein